MSLRIITNADELNKDTSKFVDYNDIYFQSITLKNDEITNKILQYIDKAHYSSENTFIGRDIALGALNKTLLSTGCKTLINIAYNPKVCFSVAECGPNALEALSFIDNGIVYWENPILFLTHDIKCNIEYNNIHYYRFMDFLNCVMN